MVVAVFGDKDTGVTFLFGLGALVGLKGFLVKRVVWAGEVGAVHAGVITGLIILSVVFCGVLPLVGPKSMELIIAFMQKKNGMKFVCCGICDDYVKLLQTPVQLINRNVKCNLCVNVVRG